MLASAMWMFLAAVTALQAQPRGVAVAGVVKDQTGGVLPGAEIAIAAAGGAAPLQ